MSASIAACHSGASSFDFGNAMMQAAARSVIDGC
jgi:hypothetical protein